MDTLTLNMILDLPTLVLKKAAELDEYADLMQKDIFNQYDFKELKQEIEAKFKRFKNAKYLYEFPLDYNIKLNSGYNLKEEAFSNRTSDPVSKLVTKSVDEQIWVTHFYNSTINLAHKFTYREARYFVDTFFGSKSEDIISERLGICRNTLQNSKKSCLIKVWLEFKALGE